MTNKLLVQEPRILPALDPGFRPVSLGDIAFQNAVREAGCGKEVKIAYEREEGLVARGDTTILPSGHPNSAENLDFLLDHLTSGMVHNGAHTLWFSGPNDIGQRLKHEFSAQGSRRWVAVDLASTSYDREFQLIVNPSEVPEVNEASTKLGGGLVGKRIGFDLGASDYKVAAFDGDRCVFTREFPWSPSEYTDPRQHYEQFIIGLKEAAAALGNKVDAIGGSSAGVWVDSRLKIGSIAKGIVKDKDSAAKREAMENFNHWLVDKTAELFGVKPVIINDGNVTAMAGQLFIPGAGGIVGIAMGSDEAGGYAEPDRSMKSKLYEWAFRPVDRADNAPIYPWAGLAGVGGMYFSQKAYNWLYPLAGISHNEVGGETAAIPLKLEAIQKLVDTGDARAVKIPATIGTWLGYSVIPYIDDSGPTSHVVVVGRCMRGKSGDIILENADRVLREEFGNSYNFQLFNPGADSFKQVVGSETAARFKTLSQAMAAATLPPQCYR
jgi:predicted NBD/HSP70 family sugar kinase